jgi:hypothetical protein
MSITGQYNLDPLDFYTSGVDFGIDIPRYGDAGQAAGAAIFSVPPSAEPPKETNGVGNFLGVAADLAEGVNNAIRAYKGLPLRPQGGYRSAGSRLGEFMQRMDQDETKSPEKDRRLDEYKQVLQSLFSDPEVLADLIVKTKEYEKKQKEDELRGSSSLSQQATPVQ